MRRTILVIFLGAALVSCGGGISCTGTFEPEPDDGAGGTPGSGGAPGFGGSAGLGGWGGGTGGGGGTVIPDGGLSFCFGPNPAGCFHNGIGCAADEICAAVGCAPSGCYCHAAVWECTADCGGGTCIVAEDAGEDATDAPVEDVPCSGPNPSGCFHNGIGCRPGETCEAVGCTSSYCYCSAGSWVCTKDCAGGSCVPVFDGGTADCSTLAKEVSSRMSGQACTAVVRLVHDDYSMIGWQLVCGEIDKVDQKTARAIAERDTGYGYGQALSPELATDEHVFYSAPGDFGGVGVVSVNTGLSVFGGSIIWMGTGELTWPRDAWEPALKAMPDCTLDSFPKWTGYDLVGGVAAQTAAFGEALQAVWTTLLPLGVAEVQPIRSAVVLRYPRSVGMFNPATAEWIVLLDSAWVPTL